MKRRLCTSVQRDDHKFEVHSCLCPNYPKDPSDVNVGFIESKEDDKDVQYRQHNIIKEVINPKLFQSRILSPPETNRLLLMPSPTLQKEALSVFTNCIIFHYVHHRLCNATCGFERPYVFHCHFWVWIAWSWRQKGPSSTERHHTIQYFIMVHIYICNFFVTKYQSATQCFALLRCIDFLPYKHSLMGILLCLCHTHLSGKNGQHFSEVIVLCFYSVKGIVPILGVIQCMTGLPTQKHRWNQ